MAETTPNFKLSKPSLDDSISPEQFNGNFDIIDDTLGKIVLNADDTATRVTALESDTGWIDITDINTNNTTTTNTMQIRKSGKIVELRGTIACSSFQYATGYYGRLFNVPEEYRPSGIINDVIAYGTYTDNSVGIAHININGDSGAVTVFTQGDNQISTLNDKTLKIRIMYFAD